MKLHVLLTTALLGSLMACQNNNAPTPGPDVVASNMDTTVKPGDDFFLYSNGGWIKQNPIPDEETRWGIGNLVNERSIKSTHH